MSPWQPPLPAHKTFPLKVKYVLLRHNPRRSMICCMDIVVLFWRLWPSLRSFSMTFTAGSIGTDVNSAFTSYDIMTSSEASLMLFRSSRKSWLLWDMMSWFSHQGLKDSWQLLGCLIGCCPNARDYGPQGCSLFMNLREPIKCGGSCPCGVEPFVGGLIHPTLCFDFL